MSSAAEPNRPPAKLKWTLGLLIALSAFVLYANTLNFDYALDDFSVIKANRLTRQGWAAFPDIITTPYRYGYYFTQDDLYRPIPKAIFAIEWALSPGNPAVGHWVNVVLYAFTGLLLFFTLSTYLKGNLIVAFCTSLFFVAHPVHTEVVANIKSLDEILGFLFLLIGLQLFHRLVKGTGRRGNAAGATGTAVLLMTVFLLALLSKESAITFLAIFPLAAYFFTDAPLIVNLKTSSLLLIPAIIFLVLRHSVVGQGVTAGVTVADNLLAAAPGGADRFATAISILGIYLKLLLFPHPLVFDRSYKDIPLVGPSEWPFIISFLAYVGLAVFAVMRTRRKDGVAFAILYYLISISIAANIVFLIGTSYGERLLYVPSLGFCLIVAFGLAAVFRTPDGVTTGTLGAFAKRNAGFLSVAVTVVALYAVKTENRNAVWLNNQTLFSHDVALAPNSTRTHYLYGNLLSDPDDISKLPAAARQSRLDAAIAELQRSVDIYPGFAEAHSQLGVANFQKQNLDEAFKDYSKAIELSPGNARYHSNMGLVFLARNDVNDGLKAFQEAVRLDPHYAEALFNLGVTYGMLKDYDNAVKNLQLCIKNSPDFVKAYYFLSGAYELKGDQANSNLYMSKYRALGGTLEKPKPQK